MPSSRLLRLLSAGLAGCFLLMGAGAPKGANPWRSTINVSHNAIIRMGINPDFIVAARVSKDAERVVLAEHRPGSDSMLHVLGAKGAYLYGVAVPSPQLADFALSADGKKAFLVGNYGTRFYTADLLKRTSALIFSSLPDSPGFRALPPIGIWNSPKGPLVYGLFYESDKVSRDLAFASIAEGAAPAPAFITSALEKEFKQVISYALHPELSSVLIVHQDPQPLDPAAPKPKVRHLSYADAAGRRVALDSAKDILSAGWLPDGKTLAYVRKDEGEGELILREIDGKPKTLARGDLFSPAFMKGGRWIVVSMMQEKKQEVWAADRLSGEMLHMDLPEGACIYSASEDGSGLVVWGGWGLRAFRFK